MAEAGRVKRMPSIDFKVTCLAAFALLSACNAVPSPSSAMESPKAAQCFSGAVSEADIQNLGWSPESLVDFQTQIEEAEAAAVVVLTGGQPVFVFGDIDKPFRAHSIRKSLMDAVLGVAVTQEKIDIHTPIGSFEFQERDVLTDVERAATLEQLAQSRSGIYFPAASETREMRDARPVRGSHTPGEHFYYNNWNFNVLGAVLEGELGATIFELYDEWVAKPAGLCDYRVEHGWYKTDSVSEIPAFKFRISARDLARFGQIYLYGGEIDSVRILPEEWVYSAGETISTASSQGTKSGYGRLWWTTRTPRASWPNALADGSYTASGTGGQRLTIFPGIDTIVVYRVNTEDRKSKRIGTRQYDEILSGLLHARIQ